MVSSFTFSLFSITPPLSRGKGRKGRANENSKNFTYFVFALLSLTLALAFQQGEVHSNYGNKPSFFFGTAPVKAAVATSALSTINTRAVGSTRVSMAAGSSRTLIELTNRDRDESSGFQIEVTYLDEDEEHGLLVLRQATPGVAEESTRDITKSVRAVYQRTLRIMKNPIVALVLAGNVASMVGILPSGVAGFLPAVGVVLGKKTKWTAAILRRLPFLKTLFPKLKVKLGKAVSSLYKNRSKYSPLSDCLWFLDFGDKESKHKKSAEDTDCAGPSADYAIA